MLAAAGNPGGGAMGDCMQAGHGRRRWRARWPARWRAPWPAPSPQPRPSRRRSGPPPLPAQGRVPRRRRRPARRAVHRSRSCRAGIANGQVIGSTLVWTNGMAAWARRRPCPRCRRSSPLRRRCPGAAPAHAAGRPADAPSAEHSTDPAARRVRYRPRPRRRIRAPPRPRRPRTRAAATARCARLAAPLPPRGVGPPPHRPRRRSPPAPPAPAPGHDRGRPRHAAQHRADPHLPVRRLRRRSWSSTSAQKLVCPQLRQPAGHRRRARPAGSSSRTSGTRWPSCAPAHGDPAARGHRREGGRLPELRRAHHLHRHADLDPVPVLRHADPARRRPRRPRALAGRRRAAVRGRRAHRPRARSRSGSTAAGSPRPSSRSTTPRARSTASTWRTSPTTPRHEHRLRRPARRQLHGHGRQRRQPAHRDRMPVEPTLGQVHNTLRRRRACCANDGPRPASTCRRSSRGRRSRPGRSPPSTSPATSCRTYDHDVEECFGEAQQRMESEIALDDQARHRRRPAAHPPQGHALRRD